MARLKLANKWYALVAIGVFFGTTGCAIVDNSLSEANMAEKTALAPGEFNQQLLPIHQRKAILNAELKDTKSTSGQ